MHSAPTRCCSTRLFRASLARFLLILSFVLGIGLGWAQAGFAQSGPVEVQTLGIDYANFPEVCLRVAPVTSNGTLLTDVSEDAFRVYENGDVRPVTAVKSEYVGSLVGVVFDASGSFGRPGSTGSNRRFDDAIAALDELVLTKGKWLQQDPKVDQLLLIAPTGPDSFKIASPNGAWTSEPVAIHNSAYQLTLANTDTPLYKMLIEAMVRMKEAPDYERRAKFLLVFSDGVDRTSPSDVTDVINRANNLGVKVLSVKIGPEGAGKTLQRMAIETPRETVADWSYADYTGPNSLAPLYSAIKSRGEQLQVCYRSKINQPGAHNIEVGVTVGDKEYKSPVRTVAIPVKPPTVRITAPADGVIIDRIANSWDQDPTTIEPFQEPVRVEVAWPDNFQRAIQQVLYEVDGSVVANLSAEEAFVWDFSKLPAGDHSLRAVVRDELGMESRSDPVRAQINITIPAPPPPTATPVPPPTPVPPLQERIVTEVTNNPVLVVVLVIALIAVILALYALIRLLRSPKPMETLTMTIGNAVRDATEIFRPKRGGGSSGLARAELVPIIDDAGTRGDPIPLRWQTTLIGRDPARVQVVFSDKSVSRLHARIVEEADHVFVLHDEGSASGTFACDEQVVVERPRTLKSGDVIEFGRQKVIFQVAGTVDNQPTEVGTMADVTEPLVKRPR